MKISIALWCLTLQRVLGPFLTFNLSKISTDHRSSIVALFSPMFVSAYVMFRQKLFRRSTSTTIDRRWSLDPTSHRSWSRLFSYICHKYTIWRRLHSSISHSTSQQSHCYIIGSRYVRGIRRQSQEYTKFITYTTSISCLLMLVICCE